MKSLEDIKKFSEAVKEDQIQLNKQSISLPNKTFLLGTLFSMFATYFHFFGYSFLKAKLERLGFDYVNIDLGIQESIYIALEGFTPAIMKLVALDFFFERMDFIILLIIMGSVIPIFFHFVQKTDSKANKIIKAETTFIEWYFRATKSFKSLALLIPATIIGFFGAFVAMFVAIIFVIIFGWMIGVLGMLAGDSKGQVISSDGVCFETKKMEPGRTYQGCREIITKNKQKLFGMKIYENDEYVYIVTNTGAYELSNDMSVNVFIPYVKKELVTSND